MEILTYPNDLLTTKCGPYDYTKFVEDLKAAVEMAGIMLPLKNCAGLAANQVGITRRFFVMRDGMTSVRYCFDPKITGHGRDLEVKGEGCMSIPGTRVAVPRWRVLSVEYVDEQSILRRVTLKGLEARVFQHEIDHLDGLLIIKPETKND